MKTIGGLWVYTVKGLDPNSCSADASHVAPPFLSCIVFGLEDIRRKVDSQ